MDLMFVVRVGQDETTETVLLPDLEQLEQVFPFLAKWAEFSGEGDWTHMGTADGIFIDVQ